MIDPIAQVLDAEFKRVAKEEDVPMSALVEEVAKLTGHSTRQLYNYRAAKWPLPAQLIPIISQRFGSTALITALRVRGDSVTPHLECANLAERSLELLKLIINHHASLLSRLTSLDAADLMKLEETTERIVQGERELYACAELAYEQRTEQRRRA